jgi:hypothetical protein
MTSSMIHLPIRIQMRMELQGKPIQLSHNKKPLILVDFLAKLPSLNPTILQVIVLTQLKMISLVSRVVVLAAPVAGRRRFGVSLQPDVRHLVSPPSSHKPYENFGAVLTC